MTIHHRHLPLPVAARTGRSALRGAGARLRRLALAVLLAVSLPAAPSCTFGIGDAFYDFVFENATDHAITVTAPGGKVQMRPCSVRPFLGGGRPYGRPFEVTARDEAGEIVYSTPIKVDGTAKGDPIYVRIAGQDADTCPAPAESYTLLLSNRSPAEVQVWCQGEEIGTVAARGSQTFGPLPGSWRDSREITIRSADGSKETEAGSLGFWMDYALGTVPEIKVTVHEEWQVP